MCIKSGSSSRDVETFARVSNLARRELKSGINAPSQHRLAPRLVYTASSISNTKFEGAYALFLIVATIRLTAAMASPPYAVSPSAMSPPYPSPAQIPNKKRPSNLDVNVPPGKRRKGSGISPNPNLSHPLRQTSFPPEAGSPYPRSPSVDAISHVSGSAVSGIAANGAAKKKRGRKAKNAKGDDSAEKTPSLVGGKAPTTVSGQGGEKDGEEEDDDEKAEMALEDVVARTQEQKQEEIRLRAMLVESFDSDQYNRYELWRAAKLSDAVVKRVCFGDLQNWQRSH